MVIRVNASLVAQLQAPANRNTPTKEMMMMNLKFELRRGSN